MSLTPCFLRSNLGEMKSKRPSNISVFAIASIWGGAETHCLELTKALRGQGLAASVVCLNEATYHLYESLASKQVNVTKIDFEKPIGQRSVQDWLRAFKSLPPEVCIWEKATLHSGNLALDLAARLYFERYLTIEQLEPMRLPPKTSKRYLGGMLRGVGLWWYSIRLNGYSRSLAPHKVITVSNSVRKLLRRDYGFPARKLVTIWNGADPERYRPNPLERQRLLREWGLHPDTLIFGSVRRFTLDKGLDLAIEAFRLFVARNPAKKAALVLVGDGPEAAALKQQVVDSELNDRVLFPGFSAKPWTIYPSFDVFVMPSRNEALSLALVEAMASGCLPIATDVGGSSEVISSPELGWLVPRENSQALCQAMLDAASLDDKERADMKDRGRQRVVRDFNANVQFSKIAALIEG